MRRGIDGLVSIIRLEYGMDPLEEGTLFLFCGRKRSSIKGIVFDGDGFIMLTKRLSDGVYQWPRSTDEAMSLSMEEFKRLMEGFTIHSSIQTYERIKSVFFHKEPHLSYFQFAIQGALSILPA